MRISVKLVFLSVLFHFACLPVAALAADYPGVARETLKNGLRVVVVRNALAPVVTVQVNYLSGSNEAPPGFPGMAHAQEHMMFRGSPGLSADQLSTIIAALGGEFNADTQQTVTQYFLTVPAEDLEVALHIEAIRMKGVLDSQKLWGEERGAIEQEVVQDLSEPEYLLETRLLASLFAGTPYEHDALGDKPSFDKTTGEMLKKYHDDWYAPNNAIVIIVGDVDPEQALASAKNLFAGIPARTLPPRPAIRLKPLKPANIEMETDQPYGLALVAYRLPGFESPDFAAGQVLADVLSSQRGDLYALVPEGKALSAEFEVMTLPGAAAGYATAAFPKGGDGRSLIARMKGIVASYVRNGFPPELVEASKRREIAQAEFRKNSINGLADAWSQALAIEGRNSPDDDIEAISKVSPADLNRVAREYLVNDTAVTAVLEPRPSGKPVAASRAPAGRESFAPKRTKPSKLPDWAKVALETPAVPSMGEKPFDMKLANGIRLIVRPTAISRTVGIYGRVRNRPELEQPKGREGVADVLDGLFSYGTTTLDRLAFQKALDDIAADESAGTSFSLQVLSKYLDRGVQLLADNLLRPALPESAFAVVREETSAALAGKMQSPSYLAHRALLKSLYPKNDPTRREATPATVSALSLGDVGEYYRKTFRPDLTTIVVIGDITPERARAVVEKYFGDWKATGPKPETTLPAVPRNKPAVVAVPDTSRVQDEVILAQAMGMKRSDPDYYRLQVGLHVLSGAFYATRLYHDLREKTGLVYTVEAFLEAGRTRSLFGIAYGCDPPNVGRAREIIEHNLSDMRRHDVTPVELRQSRTLLIRQLALSRASTTGTAHSILELVQEDLPLDEPENAARHYRDTSAAQVKAAFARWIRPAGFVQVTRGPNPH
ncbi:MAG TPA: pitrilysin family protein [Geobacteraceae bacterium]|nr:pitrilysin family protein [Geobacteraceae bacterium]